MAEHFCWWIITKGEDGKGILIFGSDKGEDDARQRGLELLGGIDFQLKRFPTRNLQRASALYRGKKLEETHDLRSATEKIGHEKTLKRYRSKLSREREIREQGGF